MFTITKQKAVDEIKQSLVRQEESVYYRVWHLHYSVPYGWQS